MVGVNERFRCCRYEPGQRFAPHYDGAFQRNPSQLSELTFVVYLNDDFIGGKTAFHNFDVSVTAHRPRPPVPARHAARGLHSDRRCEVRPPQRRMYVD